MLELFSKKTWRFQSTRFRYDSGSEHAKPDFSACQSVFGGLWCGDISRVVRQLLAAFVDAGDPCSGSERPSCGNVHRIRMGWGKIPSKAGLASSP